MSESIWLEYDEVLKIYSIKSFQLLEFCNQRKIPAYHPDDMGKPIKYEISLNKSKVDERTQKRNPVIDPQNYERSRLHSLMTRMLPLIYYLPDLIFKQQDVENFLNKNVLPEHPHPGRYFDKKQEWCDVHKASSILGLGKSGVRTVQKLCKNETLEAEKAGDPESNAPYRIKTKSVYKLKEKWKKSTK